ncbi:D-alanyl-D-alanine dipeptidase [Synechococcus sp. RSCCF101]|uniref:M15 family metallopeptidase n=1 Tax=Synechococcus sp. RSCCF101 TaxID=2511069 RepID=UPI001245186C|nr:M15 family metallopeptidase [Synechococcus sp. RSCCF101]QEY31611.1 D-alanyl-D-alanine dipeptidase [Synechococcus sp. RSCCF101]
MIPPEETLPARPWHPIPIEDCGEPLTPLPGSLQRLLPHPYARLGAPYGNGADPFRLRRGVVERLLQAQDHLQRRVPSCRLAIFDAWRPVAVQAFMVRHARREECLRCGIDPDRDSPERQEVHERVDRFWAAPSRDPGTPPPHSTGAAVDLTLAGDDGTLLAMGGAIDAIGAISEPDHHAAAATLDPGGDAALWHGRRCLLRAAMETAGFRQHPNEWWHFSWGDQLWAWRAGAATARYGGMEAAVRGADQAG